jgi:broad specificity phosphatase PhoE
MSLLLVRHGQASAGAADYDCLSERGIEQCRRLGRWLAATGHRFDAVRVGAMKRHAQSAAAVAEGYAQAGGEALLPEPELDPGFNEFDHRAVFENYSRSNAQRDEVQRAAREGLDALAPLIRAALAAWAQGAVEGVPETWSAFGERVRSAAERADARPDRRVLVLSSGGVAARLAQAALGASDAAAIDLNLSLRNSGLAEFHRLERGLALGSWNAVPHLHDARELWTYY